MELLLPEQGWSLGYLPSWKDVPVTIRTPPNAEILTLPWLENLPGCCCCCFSSKLCAVLVSVKRRIKCLPQYPREINIHKLGAMFLDAWPAGKAGMGCGAFPEGLLMKKKK